MLFIPQEISIQDTLAGATIMIEFLQLIAMGPSIKPIFALLDTVGNALYLDLGSFFDMKNGMFWIFVDFLLASVVLWIILAVTIFFRLDEKIKMIVFRFLG